MRKNLSKKYFEEKHYLNNSTQANRFDIVINENEDGNCPPNVPIDIPAGASRIDDHLSSQFFSLRIHLRIGVGVRQLDSSSTAILSCSCASMYLPIPVYVSAAVSRTRASINGWRENCRGIRSTARSRAVLNLMFGSGAIRVRVDSFELPCT